MDEREARESSAEKGIPVAPSMEPAKEAAHVPQPATVVDWRVMQITFLALLLGLAGGVVAQGFMLLIRFITSVCFYGSVSTEYT